MKYNTENELILLVAQRDVDAIELRRLLQQEINWDYLFATAQAHGLLPLLHKHLSGTNVPSHFLSRLKRESVANSQNVLHLIAKQLRVYKLFNENNIPVALFKGPLLAQMAYGEMSLRQAGDIDLLINRAHFEQARALLESLGYEMSPRLTRAQLASHLNNHCELQFMRDEWFTVVDLHWDLAPRSFVFNLRAEEVMSRLQSVSLAGTTVDTFGAEDLVLYLAMHGAKHLWRRLEWIASLAECLRATPHLDWDLLAQRAERAHAIRMLALGLRLVEKFSDVTIPVLADCSMQRMAEQVHAQLFNTFGAAHSTETNLYNLHIMDRKRDALVSVLRAIFVPTLPDWQAVTIPAPLHSLYYAFRPLRLSKVYTTSLWRRMRRDA
jgi:putative nucleotidyltransferase-like protein